MTIIGAALAPAFKWFLGAGMGMLSGLAAEAVKARQDALDKAHELALLDRQVALAEKQLAVQLADRQAAAVHEGPPPLPIAAPRAGIVDTLNGLMRPAAAAAAILVFLALSLMLAAALAVDLRHGRISAKEAVDLFGSSAIVDLIVSVWGFLFGYRNFKATRGQ